MNKSKKYIIGMCHLLPLPGEPDYNYKIGIDEIYERALKEIETLQQCNISAILISNEFGYPYCDKVDSLTQSAMSYIVGRLKKEIRVPFGIDCMYDSLATIDIALATEADFIRLTLGKSEGIDYLHGNTNIGLLIRKLKNYRTRTLPNIFLDISTPLNSISESKKSEFISCILTQVSPFAICVSSKEMTNLNRSIFESQDKKTMLICDGGCNRHNVTQIIKKADGLIIGTALKKNGTITNAIDYENTMEIMKLIDMDNI